MAKNPSPAPIGRALPVVLALVMWLAVWLTAGLLPGPAGAAEPHPLLGKPAPILSGRAAFGTGLVSLNRLRQQVVAERDAQGKAVLKDGKPNLRVLSNAVVLNFFATYCVPCVQEIPTFNRIAETYRGRRVRFLYVNVDTEKSETEVRAFAKAKGIEVEMMLPSVRYALKAYRIEALPRIVIVAPDGVVAHVILGFQDDLEAQLAELLKEVLPAENAAG